MRKRLLLLPRPPLHQTTTNAAGTTGAIAGAAAAICPASSTSNKSGTATGSAANAEGAAPGAAPNSSQSPDGRTGAVTNAGGTGGTGATANTGGTTANGTGTTANGTGTAASNGAGTAGAAVQLTYNVTIKPIIAAKCLGCHNTGQNAPVMNDYTTTVAAAAAAYADMNAKKMPPAGAGALGATDLTTFKAWIDAKTRSNRAQFPACPKAA